MITMLEQENVGFDGWALVGFVVRVALVAGIGIGLFHEATAAETALHGLAQAVSSLPHA